ncbi:heparan-alpha-glucosaminide N-acetyltransferase isoform X2 [Macrosteles quadrilineatus]|uniref:heparan-alpha-glucosaminide N-acetyltransferase isoform X2 n=1 Tax=Macrosteles quadrilineatus TaxID=74068 RepID=UPI0023E11A2D|nr:heparan-alpha-glucosaminide N-acetyltransferase isoform X2 [Macrosteles quadrilineatus]
MWPEDPGVTTWRGLDLNSLQVDEAYLNITSNKDEVYLYSISEDCDRCPFSLEGVIHHHRVFKVNTKHPSKWRLYSRSDSIISSNDTRLLECDVVSSNVGEFGVYDLIHNSSNCTLVTAVPSVNITYSLTLLLVFLLVLTSIAVIISLRRLYRNGTDNKQDTTPKRARIRSLDTFRGFMWIMGVCIPISVRSQLKRGTPRCTMFLNSLKRGCTLILLGLMLNTVGVGPQLSTLRVFGVLQRFGIVYLFVSSLAIFLTHRPSRDTSHQKPPPHVLSDVLSLSPQWIVVIAILAVHTFLTFFVPLPGCPLGYIDAGGIQDMGIFSNCTGGISRYIDQLLVGESHLFQRSTVSEVYHTAPFDPEGFLGCLTSVVQVMLGVQAGSTLLTYSEGRPRVVRWLFWGLLCALCSWGCISLAHIPINKNLWSISYVFVTSSLAFIFFAGCYLLVDHFVFWNGSPFIFPGMNSIFLYVGHTVCYQMFPWHWWLQPMNTHFLLMAEALWGTALWVAVTYWLYNKQCFITV